jgi:hypothetical protein
MRAKMTKTMMPTRRMSTSAKMMMGKKHRMMNHNVHVITPHGKIVAGRKGRKS